MNAICYNKDGFINALMQYEIKDKNLTVIHIWFHKNIRGTGLVKKFISHLDNIHPKIKTIDWISKKHDRRVSVKKERLIKLGGING